jgi:hypothetical protein
MRVILPLTATCALLALSACDEMAMTTGGTSSGGMVVAAGERSCVAAVKDHTGAAGAAINRTLPVVELNRYIVDTSAGTRFTCVTDAMGSATEIVQQQTG